MTKQEIERLKAWAEKSCAEGVGTAVAMLDLIKHIEGLELQISRPSSPSEDPEKLKMALKFLLDSLEHSGELDDEVRQAVRVAKALLYGPEIDPRLLET